MLGWAIKQVRLACDVRPLTAANRTTHPTWGSGKRGGRRSVCEDIYSTSTNAIQKRWVKEAKDNINIIIILDFYKYLRYILY